MELLKTILALVASFFQNSIAKKKEDVAMVSTIEKAVVEEIRASANAEVIVQQQETQQALEEVRELHHQEKLILDKKELDQQIDDVFGKDW